MKPMKLRLIVFATLLGLMLGVVGKVEAATIRVLRLNLHAVNLANIDGDFTITNVPSLTGVNLADFDVLYVDEHEPFVGAGFAGRQADVRAAIQSGQLGLVAEEVAFGAGPANLSAVFLSPISYTGQSGLLSLTPAGATHPSFTGTMIPGGAPVAVANLGCFSRRTFTSFPAGAVVLAEDGLGRPAVVTGTLGNGRFYLAGGEPLECASANDRQWMHNAIHFVVSEPLAIAKELISGPTEIGIVLPASTVYVIDIEYSGPEALVVDTVPAEFEILTAVASDGIVDFFKVGGGGTKGANRIEWDVPGGSNALTVTFQTVASPGKGDKFKPTSCGPLPLNDGATAFEVDPVTGEPVLVEVVDPVTGEVTLQRVVLVGPSNMLEVQAVDGAKPCVEVE